MLIVKSLFCSMHSALMTNKNILLVFVMPVPNPEPCSGEGLSIYLFNYLINSVVWVPVLNELLSRYLILKTVALFLRLSASEK